MPIQVALGWRLGLESPERGGVMSRGSERDRETGLDCLLMDDRCRGEGGWCWAGELEIIRA
jgi:hypothetical protein